LVNPGITHDSTATRVHGQYATTVPAGFTARARTHATSAPRATASDVNWSAVHATLTDWLPAVTTGINSPEATRDTSGTVGVHTVTGSTHADAPCEFFANTR
jgi:hypothetical protein